MLQAIKNIFATPELKKKVIFTLFMLLACRLGAYIPVPGIDGDQAVQLFRAATGGTQNLFQLMDAFSGGAFAHMTVVALGVMPYISASIVMQVLVVLVPSLQKEIKENHEAGKKKVGKWTRFLTVVLAFLQAGLFAKYALQLNAGSPGVVVEPILRMQIFGVPWLFYLLVMLAMTAGTILLMWIGEQITEKGVGNGISMIITVGILSSLPTTIGAIFKQLNLDSQETGQLTFSSLIVLSAVFVLIIFATILIIQGQRKIPLQYARRAVGKADEQESSNAHIPLKINYAGVIPVIFASSLLMFPATIGQFLGTESIAGRIAGWLSPGSWVYLVSYVLLIIVSLNFIGI